MLFARRDERMESLWRRIPVPGKHRAPVKGRARFDRLSAGTGFPPPGLPLHTLNSLHAFPASRIPHSQNSLQELPGIALPDFRDFLRRALGDHGAAAVAALGAEVDDIVGGLDHV